MARLNWDAARDRDIGKSMGKERPERHRVGKLKSASQCAKCQRPIAAGKGAYLGMDSGIIHCPRCGERIYHKL